jgi:predicted anti-sigma-YlaC factor YlaD
MEPLWQALLHATADEQEPLSCEECFVVMDYLADLLAAGYPTNQLLSLGEKYLQRCPECREEYRQEMAELLLVPQGSQQSAQRRPSVQAI